MLSTIFASCIKEIPKTALETVGRRDFTSNTFTITSYTIVRKRSVNVLAIRAGTITNGIIDM